MGAKDSGDRKWGETNTNTVIAYGREKKKTKKQNNNNNNNNKKPQKNNNNQQFHTYINVPKESTCNALHTNQATSFFVHAMNYFSNFQIVTTEP